MDDDRWMMMDDDRVYGIITLEWRQLFKYLWGMSQF